MSSKICKICSVEKPVELFIKNKNTCKDCNNNLRREAAKKKKEELENSSETKDCSICNENKLLKEFIVNTSQCKLCYNKLSKERKIAKQQEIIENNITEKNCKTCNVLQSINNFRAGENICYDCNKDKLYKWRENNKEQFLENCKKYRTKENVRLARNIKLKEKYHNDENYKKSLTLRHSIRQVISGKVKSLSKRNLELLGCTIEQFKQWIEFNFIDEMSWENYGTYWNLDHVTPVSYFDLTNEKDTLACFQWSNTIPEITKKNYEKFNKIDDIKIGYVRGKAYMFQDKFKYDLIIRDIK